jgi:predicted HTH domain antitoxin
MVLENALQLYKEGKISVDKAAKIADLRVSEMMDAIVLHGIKSEETIKEYREGVKALIEQA